MSNFQQLLARTQQQVKRNQARRSGESAGEVEAFRGGRLARLGLTPDQAELVAAIVACSVDPRLVAQFDEIGGVQTRKGLSVAVYAALAELDGDVAVALAHWLASPNQLVADGLIVAADAGSPAARAYVASPRLVAFLAGEAHPIEPLRVVAVPAGALHDDAQRAVIGELGRVIGPVAAVLVIEGAVGSGRATACACAAGGAEVIALDLARIAAADVGAALVALGRECTLRGAIPLLAEVDHALGEDRREQRGAIAAFVDGRRGPVIATTAVRGVDLGARRAVVRVTWPAPSTATRVALWRRAVGGDVDGDLTELAHRYRVGPGAIERAVASARVQHGARSLCAADLRAGLRHNIAERMGGLADRIEVTQTWDDLVLADDLRDQVLALIGRVRHAHQVLDEWGYRKRIARGTGVAALFSGPPGTGKTMVAGLIARELDLELYQVDLSKVVSKWVGETEKNLGRVFDAAEEGHALLLFDEADALFGQRSSTVGGANDRYANLEVNYLLQRVEAFGGIAILTTNLESAIDGALMRRLAGHVVFATPDEDERLRLWRHQTTTGTAPVAFNVDCEHLARAFPKMSGANIRNAALAAAFLAASERSPTITHDHLLRAAHAEYRSMGHMVTDSMTRRRSMR